jgi:3-phenylpropionate/trans-cinnamate dioxygenase ferredoxin reductase subunit
VERRRSVCRPTGTADSGSGPGQFAWLKLADAPHALAEHPFSYASSATCPDQSQFTIKA